MYKMDAGFTLIELLVVVGIVGVLAAIAIPKYVDYKKRGFDMRASADLRNIALAEEAYYLDAERYLECSGESCLELPGVAAISRGVDLEVTVDDSDEFTAKALHTKGSGRIFTWQSANGGYIE